MLAEQVYKISLISVGFLGLTPKFFIDLTNLTAEINSINLFCKNSITLFNNKVNFCYSYCYVCNCDKKWGCKIENT